MGADVNLTGHFTKIVAWKHVEDIELYDTMGAKQKLVYCSTTRCALEKGVKSPPRFWNRLQNKSDSILLTGIEEDDGALEMRVEIHLTGSQYRAFTLRIRLNAPPGTFLLEFDVIPFFSIQYQTFPPKSDKVFKIKVKHKRLFHYCAVFFQMNVS